jgi:nucleotide-binding universal stress UspA family protein
MFLNILAAVDGSPASQQALEQALDIARAHNALLTLLTVAPPVSAYTARAGVNPESARAELDDWADGVLAKAAATVPDGVIAHTVRRSGHAGREIIAELKRGHYDLLVLGSRRRGVAQEGLFGSVNGYVHIHSRVPILSVPDENAGATR